MTIDPDILRRAKKLLALAGKNPNANEAAAALAKAHALMAEHGIRESMLRGGTDAEGAPVHDSDNFLIGARDGWRRALAGTLAKACGCFVYGAHQGTAIVVGRPDDIERVQWLYTTCCAEIERLARRNCRGRTDVYGSARVYAAQYRFGVVDAIREAIEAEQRELAERLRIEAAGNVHALVVVDNALRIVERRHMLARDLAHDSVRLVNGKPSYRRSCGEARGRGQRDGAGVYSGIRHRRLS